MTLFTYPRLEDFRLYLVGADLTTDGATASDEKQTSTVNTDITVYQCTFEPEEHKGDILWVYFNIVVRLKGANGTVDLKMTQQVRNKGGTWQDLFSQVTYTDIGTSYVNKPYMGYLVKPATSYCTPTDADLWTYFNEVPFDFRVLLQANEADDGYGKMKSDSYIRCVYKRKST